MPTRTISSYEHIDVFSVSLDVSSVAANSVEEEAFTVTGVPSDGELLGFEVPTGLGVGVCHGFVSDADEITLVFVNPTAGAVDPDAGTFRFFVARGE